MAVTQVETDSESANQIRCWYDIESYSAYKQVESRSAADARVQKILQDIAYHNVCRYPDGMLGAGGQISLTEQLFFGISSAQIP